MLKYPEQESSTLEFKQAIPSNDQIIKTIIGFCNLHGGRLILGVKDNGEVCGVAEKDIQSTMEYLHKTIYESCTPPILPEIYTQRFGEKSILVIAVSSGMNKPYYQSSLGLSKGTFIRVGRNTLRANAEMVQELQWSRRGYAPDQVPVYHTTAEDLDREKVLEFLKARKGSFRGQWREAFLEEYQLMIEEHRAKYTTMGGLLLFAKRPQQYFTEAFIICSHFRGVAGREVLATQDCKGTLLEQFETAYAFLLQRLQHAFVIQGKRRKEVLEIPAIAIREVLLNMVVHRNYHLPSPSKIAIYDDRVEFFSPGLFPGPLSTQNLLNGITYIRNHVICRVFRELGYIEKLGSGFVTLFESYEKAKLPPPQVIEGENFIKCILARSSAQSATTLSTSSETDVILQLLHRYGSVTITLLQQELQLSRATVGRRLKQLVAEGELKKVGKGPATRYEAIA